ncbi:MAG TPA: TadE family protein [Bryobacteraceae bacterium]|nr:TadE family protein [Bryobacteraceae bacterium]
MAIKKLIKDTRGQAMLESALILLVFMATLIGIMDFGQVLWVHQSLSEQVRKGIRWGIVNPWDGTGDQIANMVLYSQSTTGSTGFLGMTRANVQVTHTAGSMANPNDERIRIAIVNYQFRFLSPWIAGVFSNNNAVTQTAAMVYKP